VTFRIVSGLPTIHSEPVGKSWACFWSFVNESLSYMGPPIRDRPGGRVMLPFALAILFVAHAAGQAANKTSTPDYSAIISDFRASIPKLMREQKVPGLALAVVDDQGILWMEGFGYTADDHKIAVTPDTLFSAQSMSKNFTAAAVLIAVQDGLLDMDTPIKEYLPGFTVNSRFQAHPEEKITLRLLLSHRAGFTHEAPVGNNYDGNSSSFEKHIRSISHTWLRFPVGQRYSYSNLGVDLAGYILQVKSGMTFQRYVKQKLLDPIGMAASSFEMDYIRRSAQRAVGHSSLPKEAVEVPMIPAGGLYTNARELARYVQFHLNGGKVSGAALINDNLLRQMYEIPSALPRQTEGYGLGIAISSKHEAMCLNHGGGGFGFLSNMIWYPEFGLGIVLLTNSSDHSFQNALPNQVLDRFIAAKLGRAPAEAARITESPQKSYEVSPSRQRMLAGQYLYNRNGYMILLFKEDRLGIERGKEFVPMIWAREDEGFTLLDGVQFSYRFVRNQDGTPLYLVRMYDGEFLDYNVGAEDRPGPNKPDWDRYLGKYRYKILSQPAGFVEVHKQNGDLFLDHMRLAEFQPGLFFTSHGEALDLRGAEPTWKSIPLEKITIPAAMKASLVVCELIFLSAILAWPMTFVARLIAARKRAGHHGSKKGLPWVARILAAMVAVLDVVLIYLLLTSLSFLIHYGIAWSARLPFVPKMGFVAFLIGAGLAFVLPIFAVLAWKRRCWTRLERLHYSLVALAALFVGGVFLAWKLPKWPL
jgi:CubicO group peptidase (beta-lactamase class C family)